MISKKTAPAQPTTGAAKPPAARVGAAASGPRTGLAAKKLPAAKKVAAKKTASVRAPRGAGTNPAPGQVHRDSGLGPRREDSLDAPAGLANRGSAAVPITTLTEAPEKIRAPRPVRDTFTMSAADYAMLGGLKQACLAADYEVKKSELVRIGIALVARLEIVALKDLLAALPPVKPSRAKKV